MAEDYKTISNLKIHIDNNKVKNQRMGEKVNADEREEGETSSEDEVEVNVIVNEPRSNVVHSSHEHLSPLKNKDYKTNLKKIKSKKHGRGFEDKLPSSQNSSDTIFYDTFNTDMRKKRAKRFGVQTSQADVSLPVKLIHEVYKSLDLCEEDFDRGGWRPDVIHARGFTHGDSSQVFRYFKEYPPHGVEWLTKSSCNVVWKDRLQAVRALHELSCPIKREKKNVKVKNGEDSKMSKIKSKQSSKAKYSVVKKKEIGNAKLAKGKTADDETAMDFSEGGKEESSTSSESETSSSESEESDDSASDSESESSTVSSSSDSSSASSTSSSSNDESSSDDGANEKDEAAAKPKQKQLPQSATPLVAVRSGASRKTTDGSVDREPATPMAIDENRDHEGEDFARAEDVGVPIPLGHWRLGVPCPDTKAILMRFAHCKDKRTPGLAKPVELYEDYLARKMLLKERIGVKPRLKSWINDAAAAEDQQDWRKRAAMKSVVRRNRLEEKPEIRDNLPFYKDLDDPVEENRNPWGFLSRNWGSRETQDNLDYQDLLRQHLIVQKRKRHSSDSEREGAYTSRSSKWSTNSSRAKRRRYDSFHLGDDFDDRASVEEDDDHESDEELNRVVKGPMLGMYADVEERKRKKRMRRMSKRSRYEHSGRHSGNSGDPFGRNVHSSTGPVDLREKLEGRKFVF